LLVTYIGWVEGRIGLGGAGGLGLDEGVHGVGQGACSVDGFRVFYAKFDLAVVGPDGGGSCVVSNRAEVGKVGRGEVLEDGEFVADTVGAGVGYFRENIIFVGKDQVSHKGRRKFDDNRA